MSDTTMRAKALLEGITPGPWELIGGGEYITGVSICVAPDDGGVSPGDAEFIAAAPELVRELVTENEQLRAGYAAAIHDLHFWAGCIHSNESIQNSMHSAARAHETRLEGNATTEDLNR